MTKKIKILIIAIFIIILMYISFLLGQKISNSKNNSKEQKSQNYSYLLFSNVSNDNPEILEIKALYAFFEDKCIDCRASWVFENEEIAKHNYDKWINIENSSMKNIKIDKNIVSFNTSLHLNISKDEIISRNKTIEFIEL